MRDLQYVKVMTSQVVKDEINGKIYWDSYSEGSKDSTTFEGDFTLPLKYLPLGTKVIVELPECPVCLWECDWDDYAKKFSCMPNCDFDWEDLHDEMYWLR